MTPERHDEITESALAARPGLTQPAASGVIESLQHADPLTRANDRPTAGAKSLALAPSRTRKGCPAVRERPALALPQVPAPVLPKRLECAEGGARVLCGLLVG
jgi:hypothetical protein